MPLHDSQQWGTPSFYFLMGDMFSAEPAILFHFQAIRIIFFILHRRIIPPLTFPTG
jgi:hypothetical protein